MIRSFPTLLASAATLALFASVPAAAVTIHDTSAAIQGINFQPPTTILFGDSAKGNNGSPVSLAASLPDGFASAQATSANNGTAIAAASGLSFYYSAIAITTFRTSFDFSPETKGRIALRISGWTIANGSGEGSVLATIMHNGTVIGATTSYSTELGSINTPRPGLQKLSLAKSFNWKGGDTIAIYSYASALVFGDYSGLSDGPGFASSYIDPVVGVTTGVPEPATWALLIAGFGMTGAAMRRRGHQTVGA